MDKKNKQGNTHNNVKKYEPSIENFICDEFSICREERQYAVFLYNILRKYGGSGSREGDVQKIFSACGLKDTAVIDHVFYEAAFMRDFYERDRRLRYGEEEKWKDKLLNKRFISQKKFFDKGSFNEELIQYVCEKMCKVRNKKGKIVIKSFEKVCNLGQNKIEFDKIRIDGRELEENDMKWINDRVKWMMNAKPDIAVIYYNEKGERELLFIECKFLSKESFYKAEYEKRENVKQRCVQWLIADFLCHYLNKKSGNKTEQINPSPIMKENKSQFVKFVRKDETKIVEKKDQKREKEKIGEILIADLIRVDREIFK